MGLYIWVAIIAFIIGVAVGVMITIGIYRRFYGRPDEMDTQDQDEVGSIHSYGPRDQWDDE